ncbi:MAG: exo-alpha-sialidase [Clostridiales bacterium]|nr:exo-alpha-sialidase [Clostridiales bacterium]
MAIRKITVSKDDSIYEAWPDVAMTNSGKLIAIFTECEHHLNRDKSRLVLKESYDRGETWGEKIFFSEREDGGSQHTVSGKPHYNCARIGKLRNGKMYIICDRIYGQEYLKSEIYVWIGNEEGTQWGEPILVPLTGIVPDKITEIDNGRIIVSAHFGNFENNNKLTQYLVYSDDGMKTWSKPIVVASHPDMNLCEASILQYNGALIAFLRENSGKGYDILKTISYDNGETWSEIYNTPMDCGHRPVSGFLKDGRVMVTYRYIPRGTTNMFSAFLRAEGLLKTNRYDQPIRIMPLDYDRNPSPDLGYTGWVQFDDGEIFVINYIKDDAEKAYIRGYKFRPEDIELPPTGNVSQNVFNT